MKRIALINSRGRMNRTALVVRSISFCMINFFLFFFSAMMENSLLLEARISVYIYGRLIMTIPSSRQPEETEMNFGKESKVII